ncbi:MAG: hypothetical protein AAF752_10655 [Bacteroidota bacterium]
MALYRNRFRIETARCAAWDYAANGGYFVTICTRPRQPWFGEVIRGQMQLSDAGEIALDCWRKIPKRVSGVAIDAFVVMPDHVHGIVWLNGAGQMQDAGNAESKENAEEDGNVVETLHATSVRASPGGGEEENPDVENAESRENAEEGENAVETLHATSLRASPGGGEEAERSAFMSAISPRAGSLGAVVRSYKSAVTRAVRRAGQPAFGWQPRFHDRIVRDVRALRNMRRYIEANPSKWQP